MSRTQLVLSNRLAHVALALTATSGLTLLACDAPSSGDGAKAQPAATADAGDAAEDPGAPAAETAPAEVAPLQPIAPEGEHPFSILDMLEADRVSSPALSPEGDRLAYMVRETDMAANGSRRSLWLLELDGAAAKGEPILVDDHPKGSSQPTWSPDGAFLYFVSGRSGSSQVWRVAMDGAAAGTPQQVTQLPVGVSNLKLSPDGATLAVSAELFPECEDLKCTAERLAARAADPTTGVAYDRMFVRHWDTWKDHRRSMLLAVDATPGAQTGRILTKGLDADVPSKPFGGSEDFTFTPDGEAIVFAARDAAGGGGEPWSTNFDLFRAPIDASEAPTKLTTNPAWDAQPQFSPDGKQLAWLAMERPGYEADRFRLIVQDWDGSSVSGEPKAVTQEWDRSISGFTFTAAGDRVFATAQHLGHKPLFAIDLASGAATPRVAEGTVAALQVGADKLVWSSHDLSRPAELFAGALDDPGKDGALTHLNDALMKQAKVGEAEQFQFEGANGDTVYGWIVKPVDFDPTKRYPIAFLIHGGPQGSFGNKFHYRWNPQTYAGAGYAAVMIDFHGSTGYGQAFTDSIGKDWGGKPLEDLQKGLSHVVERYAWVDGERACALGASYGGFMINWIAGNWHDRFSCLVNHDGVFDQRSMYYSTEELWFPEWEQGGPEYANRAGYARFNPVDHVEKWQTPMLVIHGSQDFRVPVEQGLGAFTALQRRGIESRFLHYPNENHWVLQPANSKQWHDEVLAWLAAHLDAPSK
ncbi:peptidase, S9C (acylaminoacyl-peptidase) subfamily protein [Plesiocystis pacifica SIR-1]|uniref:Peptidase, S9C (Acylaminoacyl-peptidase) subfamily protein n=1 Tax=Plesiocystis pacifica SIR-1 TaxID=391625 RepID=A6G310_9BACT|nr:S9 family peptidase [Plesiocystis pacifica]EDM79860.1 peptidase, S9C (acylaminoacyl-peptidase) subfamily protein [Plesiocystis pacifica SIR-1]